MRTNFIYSTSYHDALRRIVSKINSRKVDLSVRHLLIVPERYTLMSEKLLYENSSGSFDVEVLSLSRLFYRMNIATQLLSREGAIMLIRGMLPSLGLKCFHRSALYRGFCEKLYDAINDFAAEGVLPEDIPDSSPRLSDIKKVYSEYLDRIRGRFVDSMGKLNLIAAEAATSPYLDNVHIYIANFDYVDGSTRKVFDALASRALSVTEAVRRGDIVIGGKVEKFKGEGADAVKEAAKRLRYAAYNGVAYEDMAVVIGEDKSARIKRIFEEFDIPCFISESRRLIDHPLSGFVLRLFECARRKSRENFVILSKNLYVSAGHDADKFENYVNSNLVEYGRFYSPFDDPQAESVRRKLVSLVNIVDERMGDVRDAVTLGSLLEEIFAATSVERICDETYGTGSPAERMRELVSLMAQTQVEGDFDFVSAVFAEGLKAAKMSSIPYNGGVTVGDPASFRGGRYKFMVVLGFDDGVLPQIYDESSLIDDEEKALFGHMARAEEIDLRYETELRAALSGADEIFITYTEPSAMMQELFGDVENADTSHNILLESGSRRHAVEYLIGLVGQAESALEYDPRVVNALYAATACGDELFVRKRTDKVECAERLFFPSGRTGVSQLQRYFGCPFRHYADYGLRLKDRDKGVIGPLDIGNFLHLVAERTLHRGDLDDMETSVAQVVDEILSEGGKLAMDCNRELVAMLTREATEALSTFASHLKKGKFVPIGEEIPFETELSGITLVGKIDMADVYDGYIRLIDHKTGKYELTFGDVYYGKKIQLPLYMKAACLAGYKKGAMFNYPLFYDWQSDKFAHRFSGILLRDEEIMAAVDADAEESEVFNLGGVRNEYLLNAEQMDSVVDYAVKVALGAVQEIKEGYVTSSPFGDECDFCEYSCLCDKKSPRRSKRIYRSALEKL